MSKRFKLKFSRVMPSFQLCRSKKKSEYPLPSIYGISTFNRKALDINYPKLPDPPPPTPTPTLPATTLAQYLDDCSTDKSSDFSCLRKVINNNNNKLPASARLHRPSQCSTNLSFSDDSFENLSPVILASGNQKNKKYDKDETGVPSEYDGCFTSEEPEENNETDTESLILSSTSFSYDSSFDFCYPVETTTAIKKSENRKNKKKKTRDGNEIGSSPMRGRSVLRRMMPCRATGKVQESVAVMKKSEHPFEDFKRSMIDMILEKQISEEKDLEELLQCFLSLNSRQYHGIIVQAFSDIWEYLFCDSPVKKGISARVAASELS